MFVIIETTRNLIGFLIPRGLLVTNVSLVSASVCRFVCYYAIVESVWREVVFVRYVTKMERKKFEQRCAVKFCVKLAESATVAYEKLQKAYGEHSLSRAQVFSWHKYFWEGQERVEEKRRAGRPSTSETDDNVERVRPFVRWDLRLTLRTISSELSLTGLLPIKFYHGIWPDELECCTTTTHHVTWQFPSTNFCGSTVPPIRQMSILVTSFYSSGSKTTWKGAILVLRIISRRA
jgi:hypothetical protein